MIPEKLRRVGKAPKARAHAKKNVGFAALSPPYKTSKCSVRKASKARAHASDNTRASLREAHPTLLDRRVFMLTALAALVAPRHARARTVIDDAGRQVPVSAPVTRVFPAGPPAAILLYTLAPETLLGWPRANRKEEREFLLPDVGSRPELGRLTGRGSTANLELVLALKPDLILDVGYMDPVYVSLAERVQHQTGIPYVLLDGHFDQTAVTYRKLGELMDRSSDAERLAQHAERTMKTITERTAAVPPEKRPRVYYARGPRGLDTALGGSINIETIEFLGARNVAGDRKGGLVRVSIEQVLSWNPEVIITIDRDFAANVWRDPSWAAVAAVRSKRVHLSPKLPFGWVDFPPSVNRLIGLWWLGKVLYPDRFPEDLHGLTRDFYREFYHVTPNDEQIERVLAGRH